MGATIKKGKRKSGTGRSEDYLIDGFCYCKADFRSFFSLLLKKSWVVNVDTGQISRCHSNSSTKTMAPQPAPSRQNGVPQQPIPRPPVPQQGIPAHFPVPNQPPAQYPVMAYPPQSGFYVSITLSVTFES